jgi:hypothetical protein
VPKSDDGRKKKTTRVCRGCLNEPAKFDQSRTAKSARERLRLCER